MNSHRIHPVSRQYLLLPSPPTPNGRLHLGHIGGPYLRMDILKRGVEILGHKAAIVLTLDSYESFVMLAAKNNDCDVETIIDHYAELIAKDLASMKIDTVIINPLDLTGIPIIDGFPTTPSVHCTSPERPEIQHQTYYYCEQDNKCISGAWLMGNCPSCGMKVSGDCCDGCSAIIQPQTLLDAHPRFDEDGPMTTQSRPCPVLQDRAQRTCLGRHSN